jgi:SagB-type dehydrogenase family enzyme
MEPKKVSVKPAIRPELLNTSAYLNGYSPFVPWSNAIGCKPNLIKYTERYCSSFLAEEYLLNSYYTRGDVEAQLSVEQFYADASIVMQSLNNHRDYINLPIIPLPAGIALEMSLGDAILKRRSVSQFTGDAISINYLATIARVARGISDKAMAQLDKGNEVRLNFNAVSSAGHLYPVDLYFLVLNVKGLKKGIYLYSDHEDKLIQTGDAEQASQILASFSVAENYYQHTKSSYICLFAAHPWKSMSKYGNRGLRFVLQEIGAMTQNIHLANVCLGLGSVDWGSYYENEVNQVMGFDGVNQSVLHVLLAGISG